MAKSFDPYSSGRAAMPHVMALNSDPTKGLKNQRQPAPQVSKVVAFAKGGAVKSTKIAPKMAAKAPAKGNPFAKSAKACPPSKKK